jgi:RNA polymerase sigma factor (sigma-70 family)
VLKAGQSAEPAAREALERLCQLYWFPLYAHARRRGYSPADAEDLTQGFFQRLLRLNSLAGADPAKGRFRSFLLTAMEHYISDEWDRAHAQKRAVQKTIPLDTTTAETRYRSLAVEQLAPDRLFERQWALTLLENVLQQLRREYEASGRGALFMRLRFAITGERSLVPYSSLATSLEMSEAAVRVAVHRLRQRYRELLRAELAGTVTDEADIAAELMYLRQVLSGR